MSAIVLSIIGGLSIGFMGSFHCIGMCGPLALSLPIHHLNAWQKYSAIALYNLGRAFTYGVLGMAFGLIGQSFTFFKIQQWLSIIVGVLMLIVILYSLFGHIKTNFINKMTQQVQMKLGHYLSNKNSAFTFFNVGILNGLLPCGLVYVAIAASIATGSVLHSSVFMISFGLGTLPIMALTMVLGKFISLNTRQYIRKISPYAMMLVAILLIVRGLNLGVPYVSPKQEKEKMSCCHK